MTQARFEDLPVWQTAAQLYEQTEELLEHGSLWRLTGSELRVAMHKSQI
jgi:hypothetical protein